MAGFRKKKRRIGRGRARERGSRVGAGADAGAKRGEGEQRGELIIRSRVVRCHPTGLVE